MSPRFSPKFTIATAYPMMFSSADLKHIETETRRALLSDSVSSLLPASEPCNRVFLDSIETPTELYRWVTKRKSERLWTLSQIKHPWENDPEESPKEDQKRPETT